MRISDWSSDVCSSDLVVLHPEVDPERAPFEPAAAAHGEVRRLRHPGDAEHALVEPGDRKSVVSGKRVSVRVDLGGRRIIKKKTNDTRSTSITIMIASKYPYPTQHTPTLHKTIM